MMMAGDDMLDRKERRKDSQNAIVILLLRHLVAVDLIIIFLVGVRLLRLLRLWRWRGIRGKLCLCLLVLRVILLF